MYSRGFERGIESDGVLREMERRYEAEEEQSTLPPPREASAPTGCAPKGNKKLFGRFDTEDLLIVAIVLLLLSDGDADNDIIIIALAFLLLF